MDNEQKSNSYCGRPVCIDVDDCECMSIPTINKTLENNTKWESNTTFDVELNTDPNDRP